MERETGLEHKLCLWGMAGPSMNFLTLSLAVFYGLHSSLYFCLASSICFPICWHWRLKGLAPSAALLSVLCFFLIQQVSVHQQYLVFGITLSLALDCLITVLSAEEINVIFAGRTIELERRFGQIRKLADDKAKLGRQKELVEQKNKRLEADLESYRNMIVYYQRSKKENISSESQDSYEAMYRQLRSQFDEKIEILHQTRKELFIEKEKNAALINKSEEPFSHEDSQVADMQKHILNLDFEREQEREKYMLEIKQLEELVSNLQNINAPNS